MKKATRGVAKKADNAKKKCNYRLHKSAAPLMANHRPKNSHHWCENFIIPIKAIRWRTSSRKMLISDSV